MITNHDELYECSLYSYFQLEVEYINGFGGVSFNILGHENLYSMVDTATVCVEYLMFAASKYFLWNESLLQRISVRWIWMNEWMNVEYGMWKEPDIRASNDWERKMTKLAISMNHLYIYGRFLIQTTESPPSDIRNSVAYIGAKRFIKSIEGN